MLPFSTLLHISRPRFWHYVLGPMLILFASSSDFFEEIQGSFMRGGTDWVFYGIVMMIILGYFTLPANLWIYGWNDIADGDTDKFNNKKGSYEIKVEDTTRIKKKLKKSIWIWNIGYLLIGSFLIFFLMITADCFPRNANAHMCDKVLAKPWMLITGWGMLMLYSYLWLILGTLVGFFITSYLYSCKPLRAKAKPFIDGIMNVLYIAVPMAVLRASQLKDYIISSTEYPYYIDGVLLYNSLSALFRCMAMHCYSAIPDIEPDRQAGLNTTAVYLGKQKSLIYCIILYLLSAILSFPTLGWFSIVAGIVYMSMMVVSYTKKDIFGLYKLFPWINLIVGFSLFWYIIIYL